MESFYFLVPIALIFVAIALRFLFWALNSGQYDNLDTEAHRILFDEDSAPMQGKQTLNPVEPAAADTADETAATDAAQSPGLIDSTSELHASSKVRAHD